MGNVFKSVGRAISKGFKWIGQKIYNVGKAIYNVVKKVGKAIIDGIVYIVDKVKVILEGVEKIVTKFNKILGDESGCKNDSDMRNNGFAGRTRLV